MRFSVRREDRRNLLVGFVGLMTIMTAHSVMETARDTLFLTNLPATDLPRAYLAIALLAIVELKIYERVLPYVRDRRVLLAASLCLGALITLGFWALLETLGPWAPFGFYVWTGLLITVVLIEFWLLLDDAVTVTQAKRIFPAIAAGGVSGAMLGSLLSEGLLRVSPASGLVFLAASILALAAGASFLWRLPRAPGTEPATSPRTGSLRWLLHDAYLSRVLALVLFGTVTLTVVDFIFKSSVAQSVPTEGLGPFFARFYLGLNSVALLVQVAGAGWLLQAFGAPRSSALLPALIFGGALGLTLGPMLPFAVALKAVDGSLRHTLYRSSVEVLYLPLDSLSRERAKGIIEVFGHRIGQALGSVLIISAVSIGLATRQLAVALVVLTGAWLAAIFSTRNRYVEQFRARLRQGVVDTSLKLEELDRQSIDALLNALNSEDDEEVLAAIGIFDSHGRAGLMPVLVLYHPSTAVRRRALEAFADASDTRFLPVARRMLADEDPDVRATALRVLIAADPNRSLLEEKVDLEASIVQATALVGLVALEQRTGKAPSESVDRLDEWVASASPSTRSALARAIRKEGGPVFHDTLIELIQTDDREVQLDTLRAMEATPDPRFLRHLLPLLGGSDLREAARRAIVAIGPDTVTALDEALADARLSTKVRRRIPQTIIRFEPEVAAEILQRHLELDHDDNVRLKILRALNRLQAANPDVELDHVMLGTELRATLLRIGQLMRWRAALEDGQPGHSQDSELLIAALRDKERATLQRAFWLMWLQHPEENLVLVWRGLQSENPRLRAASVEVLEAVLSGGVREAVLALVDVDQPTGGRARAAVAALGESWPIGSVREALDDMVADRSEVVRSIASHHLEALGPLEENAEVRTLA